MAYGQTANRFFTPDGVDQELRFDDGATTYTSAGDNVSEISSSATQLDLTGANGSVSGNITITSWVDIAAVDGTSADETYVLRIDEATDTGFTDITGTHTLVIDRDTADDTKFSITYRPQARFIRHVYVLGGTTPSLQATLGWVSPAKS